MCGFREDRLPFRSGYHYCRPMPIRRGFSAACALALALVALLALAAPAAAATPVEIYTDFVVNGELTGDYAVEDLRAALEEANQEGPFYATFVNAVDEKLEADYLGRSNGEGGGDLIGASEEGGGTLPEPRTLNESGDPPWPFLALVVLAGALVVTGAGSSIYRRARR
jgi:hypothetical protein